MKKVFDSDDEILGLVRQEGLLKPSEGFTSHVMQLLEENKASLVYEPLLGRKTWIILVSVFALLSVICWKVFATGSNEEGLLGNTMEKAAAYLSNINFSFEINGNALLIITLAMVCMGLLVLIDLWFSNNNRRLEA